MNTTPCRSAQAPTIEKFCHFITDMIMKRDVCFNEYNEVNEANTAIEIIEETAYNLSKLRTVNPSDIADLLTAINDYATRANDHLTRQTAKGATQAFGLLLLMNMEFERVRDDILTINAACECYYESTLHTNATTGGEMSTKI